MLTPNQFELGFITDRDALSGTSSLDDILSAVDEVRALGPSTVLVTSVDRAGAPDDAIEMLAVTEDGAWLVTTPRLPMKANGSGDITAALFTAHLHGRPAPPADALARTASSVFAVLKETLDSGERELRLIAAQDAIAVAGVRVRGRAGPLTAHVRQSARSALRRLDLTLASAARAPN